MISIVTIGSAQFALPVAKATKVLELLGSGHRVERTWVNTQTYYWPATKRNFYDDLEVKVVKPEFLLTEEPKDDEPLPPSMAEMPKRELRGQRGQKLLTGGAK